MTTIYVGNLNFKSTEEEIEELFAHYGPVSSVKVITDRETGRSRGFGFVEMEEADAEEAIKNLNGFEHNGRNLKVHFAKEKSPNNNRQNRSFSSENRNRRTRY